LAIVNLIYILLTSRLVAFQLLSSLSWTILTHSRY
jgi:hypothetical protein